MAKPLDPSKFLARTKSLTKPLLGGRTLLAPPRLFGDALDAPLGLVEVREHQLGLDRLDVAQLVDVALGVDHVLVAMG